MHKPYRQLFLALSISFGVMYGVMYLNVDQFDHVRINLSRLYMTLLMITPMAVIMLLLMPHMYGNNRRNWLIGTISGILFSISLLMLRNQTAIGDQQYMQAMIPHHSVAIHNSQAASIHDPEVRELAQQIVESQEREIAEMNRHLARLQAQADSVR